MHPKILVVDDIENNLLSIEAILEQEDYKIIKANSGRQALKVLLDEHDFALILMDVQMPNLDGFDTAAMIYEREKLRHIPIIFITAHSYGDENIFKGYLSGAVDYIYKPINPALLRVKVSVFVELYRKNHALIAQEQKLKAINRNLEIEVNERKISEEKITELNRQLLESIDRLEAANKDLDRFAFMASHDLQEPLRKIRMYNNLLYSRCQETNNEEGKMYIDRIEKSAERMQSLIKDILMFSKISTEKLIPELTDMNTLVQEVISDMESNINESQASVFVNPLPQLNVYPSLVKLLISNLINNALKYKSALQAPIVKIYSDSVNEGKNADPDSGNSGYCRIFIEDNGIGFEQKYAEQIFSMFQRLHTSAEYEGTGIGLALCKKIAEEHSGYISAISKVEQGSTFIVSLPLSVAGTTTNHP